jgi:catechol 2,3-dioxygenase-like lactoylglutathione lyase family enzyme
MKMNMLFVILLIIGMPLQGSLYRDPGLKKVVQVAFVCRDVEATSKRWATVLGVDPPKIWTTRPGHEVKMIYRGKPSEGQAKIAIINAGQVDLEFLQPLGDNSSWKDYLNTKGEGVQHIAFRVDDPAKTTEFFKQLGMGVVHQGRFDDDDGTYIYIDSRDQLLVNVELLHDDPKK